jgi:hypothetical protein
MESTAFGLAQYEVDGGYLPGGPESAELSDSLTETHVAWRDLQEDPEPARESIDASLFAAMLHP